MGWGGEAGLGLQRGAVGLVFPVPRTGAPGVVAAFASPGRSHMRGRVASGGGAGSRGREDYRAREGVRAGVAISASMQRALPPP